MPEARDIPEPLARANFRTLLAGGPAHQALETAVAAALRRGAQVLGRGPATGNFLLALRAVAEELEGIAAALAAGEVQGKQAEG